MSQFVNKNIAFQLFTKLKIYIINRKHNNSILQAICKKQKIVLHHSFAIYNSRLARHGILLLSAIKLEVYVTRILHKIRFLQFYFGDANVVIDAGDQLI